MAAVDLTPLLPKGSPVLVTGATGFIASHIVRQLLKLGYRVRGTARTVEKAAWMHDLFREYGAENLEIVSVPDIAVPGAFDEAVKGMAGVIHVASIMGGNDPNLSITPMVRAAKEILQASAAAGTVKRVVVTSSSVSAYDGKPNIERSIEVTSWNDEAVERAWAPPPYTAARASDVYVAMKLSVEKALWDWMAVEKPSFALNTVLPNVNIGRVLDVAHQGWPLTPGLLRTIFLGGEAARQTAGFLGPQFFIAVQDDARVHVGALLHPDIRGERLFAFATPFTWPQAVAAMKKKLPGREFVDLPDQGEQKAKIPVERALEVHKWVRKLGNDWEGGEGWTPLDVAVADGIEGMEEA